MYLVCYIKLLIFGLRGIGFLFEFKFFFINFVLWYVWLKLVYKLWKIDRNGLEIYVKRIKL